MALLAVLRQVKPSIGRNVNYRRRQKYNISYSWCQETGTYDVDLLLYNYARQFLDAIFICVQMMMVVMVINTNLNLSGADPEVVGGKWWELLGHHTALLNLNVLPGSWIYSYVSASCNYNCARERSVREESAWYTDSYRSWWWGCIPAWIRPWLRCRALYSALLATEWRYSQQFCSIAKLETDTVTCTVRLPESYSSWTC